MPSACEALLALCTYIVRKFFFRAQNTYVVVRVIHITCRSLSRFFFSRFSHRRSLLLPSHVAPLLLPPPPPFPFVHDLRLPRYLAQGPFGSQALSSPLQRLHAMAASRPSRPRFCGVVGPLPHQRFRGVAKGGLESKRLNGFPAGVLASILIHSCPAVGGLV